MKVQEGNGVIPVDLEVPYRNKNVFSHTINHVGHFSVVIFSHNHFTVGNQLLRVVGNEAIPNAN